MLAPSHFTIMKNYLNKINTLILCASCSVLQGLAYAINLWMKKMQTYFKSDAHYLIDLDRGHRRRNLSNYIFVRGGF